MTLIAENKWIFQKKCRITHFLKFADIWFEKTHVGDLVEVNLINTKYLTSVTMRAVHHSHEVRMSSWLKSMWSIDSHFFHSIIY